MKYSIVIIILLCFSSQIFAQVALEPQIGFPNLRPLSPDVSSLMDYNKIDVGLFTGTVHSTVPLYKIKYRSFILPIYLNYSSNGIKVDQISSNVGLGWTLFAGGVISRQIMDDADENTPLSQLPEYPFGTLEMDEYLGNVNFSPDTYNTQPDVFSYNFNGYSGSFFLDNSLSPIQIEPNGLKVEIKSGFEIGAPSSDYSFLIITPNGYNYWFGGNNAVETSSSMTIVGGSHTPPTLPEENAWYLKKIIFPSGKDSVIFEYDQSYAIYFASVSQTVTARIKTDPFHNGGVPQFIAANHTAPDFTKIFPHFSRISRIYWPEGEALFHYSPRFSDCGTNNFVKIDSVIVKDNDENLIQKIQLAYMEILADSDYENPDASGLDPSIYKRLFLKSVHDLKSINNQSSPYSFMYFEPEKMPPRLSYSQDYWGFFNGKENEDLVPDDLSWYYLYGNSPFGFNLETTQSLFNQVGGDRNASSQFGKIGLLYRIDYPTGGFDSIQYSSNSVSVNEYLFPDEKQIIDLSVATDDSNFFDTACFTTGIIPFDQPYRLLVVNVDTNRCWQIGYPSHHIKLTLVVTNTNTGLKTPCYTYNRVTGIYTELDSSLTIGRNSQMNYYFTFQKDQTYEFKIDILKPCLIGGLWTSYYTEPGHNVVVEKEIGGMRVEKIESNDGFGNQTFRSFHYNYYDNPDSSSLIVRNLIQSISVFEQDIETFYLNQFKYTMNILNINLSSSTLFSITNFDDSHLNYKCVIEEHGEDFINGATVHKFGIVEDAYPNVYGYPILGTPNSNTGFNNGKELEVIHYRNLNGNLVEQNKVINLYRLDNRLQKEIIGFTTSISKRGLHLLNNLPSPVIWYSYDFSLAKYFVFSQWHSLYQTINIQYNETGENPLVSTTKYYYDNADHLQLTRTSQTTSTSDSLVTISYYPDDVESLNSLPGGAISQSEYSAIDRLKLDDLHRIAEPVQNETYRNTQLLKRNRIKYKDWATVVMPEFLQQANGGNTLENRIVYHHYDIHGNPVELSKSDDTHSTYLWGYNYSKVIAEIKNARYEEDMLVAFEELNSSYEGLQSKNEVELLDFFIQLRELLTSAQVTSFTYDPLKGMITLTDPNGRMINYEYDDYGRLESVLDQDEHVIKKFEYNYLVPNRK
ncbi:MAG: hypothetical protein EOM59_11215 [Clostridia bacterium]|nr:hypothetical protein [Clostridia bacterium]